MDKSLNNYIQEYKNLLEKGDIQKAYQGLMGYIKELRNHFMNTYPDRFVVGHFYQGYMDVSYFTLTTESLRSKKLKIGLFFDHASMSFGVCLLGQNKAVQDKYWKILKGKNFSKYSIPSTSQDVVIESVLVENPNFDDLNSLTELIENKAIIFIDDIIELGRL